MDGQVDSNSRSCTLFRPVIKQENPSLLLSGSGFSGQSGLLISVQN